MVDLPKPERIDAPSTRVYDPMAGMEFETAPEIKTVQSIEEAQQLPPGTKFRDPSGTTRIVPYKASSPEEALDLPDEAHFTDPSGRLRQAPKYEGFGFSAQALYDMAGTEHGKEEVLKKFFENGEVKRTARGDFVVKDENGVWRRPGRGVSGVLGRMASEMAPAIGTVGGGALGGAGGALAGTVAPGPGNVAGAGAGGFMGMVGGAMLGQSFNNMVLGLAGIHDRSLPEQLRSISSAGAYAAGGEVLGKGIGAAAGGLNYGKTLVEQAGSKFLSMLEAMGITPERARYVLGARMADVERAAALASEGAKVGPSAYAKEAPGLRKIVEEFDPQFRRQNVIAEANQAFYEKKASEILRSAPESGTSLDTLVQEHEPLTRATAKVSSEEAGKIAIAAARLDMEFADAAMENAQRSVRETIRQPIDELGGPQAVTQQRKEAIEHLERMQRQARDAAESAISYGLRSVQQGVDSTFEAAKAGRNTGDLWRAAAKSFKDFETAIKFRARKLYDAARDAVPEGMHPETSGLIDDAVGFMNSIPEAVRGKYPTEIRMLAKLAGQDAEHAEAVAAAKKAGQPEPAAPEPLSFADLHHLRSWMRHGIDYTDLTPDMRAGALKLFEGKINRVLHDPKAPEELQEAAGLLDTADKFYAKNMPFLHDSMVKSVMKGVETGVSNDPASLAEVLFQPGRTEAMGRARKILGQNLWRAVQAADTDSMVNAARTHVPGEIDGQKFAQQVLDRVRNGIMDSAYDKKTAQELQQLAQNALRLEGKLPIGAQPGDSVSMLLQRASEYAKRAEEVAKEDPLKALQTELERMTKEFKLTQKEAQTKRAKDPLHFLYQDNMSGLAVKAADRVLGSQDLIMAAAQRFGTNSAEFNALRQVYVWRLLQRPFGKVPGMREEIAGERSGITEEMQSLLFPGVSRENLKTLVSNMEFLFGDINTDVGGAMAAASRVLHPWQAMPIPAPKGVLALPGATFAGRFLLGKYFAMISEGVMNPVWLNWLAGKVRGDAVDMATARLSLQNSLRLGGWIGAGVGESQYQRRQ